MIHVLPGGEPVQENEILNYKTDDFFIYFEIWENFHYFGLPHGRGSVYEKKWVIQIIKTFQKCYDLYQAKQMQKR